MATFKQYDTKQGKKWLFKVYLGINAATGKRIETTRRNFPTKKAVQLELSRLQVEFEKNGSQRIQIYSRYKSSPHLPPRIARREK